jgi:hypothetical protein
MTIKLQDLRRYAIERRAEIAVLDSASGRKCVINVLGQVKIPGDDKDFNVEPVIESADQFEIKAGEKVQKLSRANLAGDLTAYFNKGNQHGSDDEEE